jgi:hypothetical protein
MKVRSLIIPLAMLLVALSLPSAGHAVPATNFTLDKSSYNPGDSGKASIVFYNDQGSLIRITSVDMSFNYYYQDGRVYSQDFLSPALGMNVSNAAVSQLITLQFSLPSGIATGYITPTITVTYNIFNGPSFGGPNQDTSRATSPLVLAASSSTQTIMYVFVATTVLFAALTFYFATRYWSNKSPANRPRTS